MDKIDDIVSELKQKDYHRFDTFYNLTKKQVYFSIITIIKDSQLTEDLLQETYMKFLEKIDNCESGRNISAYLVSIGRNLAINVYNKRKKEVYSEEIFETIPAEEIAEDDQEIFKILDILSSDEKEIVVMHVINDLKFREIADIIHKPIGTVLWVYNKAIKKLKEKVGDVI